MKKIDAWFHIAVLAGGNALKCRCGHDKDRHTIDAPQDYMGCEDCGCSEYSQSSGEVKL